ncbi:MAG: hypothetical protein MJZ74_05050 [Muribaculaceae bacterium]|nr:hypothetical protein [Muribaculaceae bacterium]
MDKLKEYAIAAGLLIMLAMAALPLLDIMFEWMPWVYATGAAIVFIARLTTRYHGDNLRAKRLHTMLTTAAIMYCASAALIFYSKGTSDWIALLLAGAVMQTYATFMLEKVEKTEKKDKK